MGQTMGYWTDEVNVIGDSSPTRPRPAGPSWNLAKGGKGNNAACEVSKTAQTKTKKTRLLILQDVKVELQDNLSLYFVKNDVMLEGSERLLSKPR